MPTIRDVAREAGVSVATVSRVFNDSGPVRAETRERIRRVAQRLRFVPNTTARSLTLRRTHTVGVLLPDLHGEFFSEVIRGLDQGLRQHGYHVLVSSSHNERAEIASALQAMRGRLDGVIVMAPDVDVATIASNVPDALPVLLLNTELRSGPYESLNIDSYGGAYAMTRHLLGGGYREIALIMGPERNHDAQERVRGFRQAMSEAGVPVRPELLVTGDFTESAGHRLVVGLVAQRPRPTAVFAANDSMAVGALSGLREAGLRVPEDIAVVGFDDVPIARYLNPPLTTIRVAISELGARAAARLVGAMAAGSKQECRQELLATELVIRRSCGVEE